MRLRNALVERYLPFAHNLAKLCFRTTPDCVSLDDLKAAAMPGLIEAVERFEPARGLKFETFAYWRVRGSIADALRVDDSVSRLTRIEIGELEEARERARQKCGGEPTAGELAAALGISETALAERERAARAARAIPIDATSEKEYEGRVYEDAKTQHADPREPSPETSTQHRDLLQLVLRDCRKAERLLLILYYYEELTMQEIGKTLGLSESRVSQMHAALLKRLRGRLAGRESEFTESEPGAR
jgi:RNA polymerase sigma factor for flagellar operon FliA